jgi:hypothetical protein
VVAHWALGITYAMADERDKALASIEEMKKVSGPKDMFHIALTYAVLGDLETAMDWMDKAF